MSMSMKELDQTYVAGTYKRFPVEIVSGKGSVLEDINGKKYIDLGSGIGVTSFGFGDEEWKKAVTDQMNKVQHTSNLYYTEPCAKLAQLLCEKSGMKKVFFGNSGAEANECAIKVARKYAMEHKGPEYNVIVTLKNSFHGRTLTTLAATGQDHFHELFQPLTPGFVHTEAGNIEDLKSVIKNNNVAAVMIECVQGEGGVVPLDEAYVKAVADCVKENDCLLIVDEVQTGNGRTGKFYSYMHFGLEPDIVSTAKGLGGGLPIGACLLSDKVKDVLTFGDHGSTFGGNPMVCAGACSIVSRIDDAFLEEVNEKSKLIFDTLQNANGIEDVCGLGLMIGIKTTKPAGEVVTECIHNGVLCLTAKDKVRLLPALNISKEVLADALEVIKKACVE